MKTIPRRILPVIVVSQLAGASLWFAVNAVLPDLQRQWGFGDAALGWLTSAIQFGFICGTLAFAMLAIADRFSPRRVFLACAIAGALCNAAAVTLPPGLSALLVLRFLTGFFLAGIYPVGMKIASGWYRQQLGAALGFLVGALVLGTALPHALRAWGGNWPWQQVMIVVSCIAVAGGIAMFAAVPDGPHIARGAKVDPRALAVIWRNPKVRASALGYFGHMWELYAFIVVVPAIIGRHLHTGITPGVSALSFVVIGAGAFGCVIGGLLAARLGSANVAAAQLAASGICCLAAPWMPDASWWVFLTWMLVWGTTVSGDSPQFSTLTARNSPKALVGSVLTFVNCIGFSITIASIEAITGLSAHWPLEKVLPMLAVGPILGLFALRSLLGREDDSIGRPL
jgi:MFS transporter, DHA1 family, inner membrane transport protein